MQNKASADKRLDVGLHSLQSVTEEAVLMIGVGNGDVELLGRLLKRPSQVEIMNDFQSRCGGNGRTDDRNTGTVIHYEACSHVA